MKMPFRCLVLPFLVAYLLAAPAAALDKQGSAHGGKVEGNEHGFAASGSASIGASFYNPSYAARPDNSGLALFRYAVHADVDLIGRHLSIPIDVNLFTDKLRAGLGKFAPSELDVLSGVTTTFRAGPGAMEMGARFERDMPVDIKGRTQTYVDARARYLFALSEIVPSVARTLRGGDISGNATLGWFIYNPSYAARPDNSGLALFRYGVHWQVSMFHGHIALGLDAAMFTDRKAAPLKPSELDFTPEIVGRLGPCEVHVAVEHDQPLTRIGTLSQTFAYGLFGYNFDLYSGEGK